MRKSSGQYCSAIGCSMNFGSKQEISLFSFPNPKCKSGKENAERSKQWVKNCRRQDLLSKSAEYLNRNCCFCAKHFEDNQFMNAKVKKRLVHDAVPTIFPEIPNAVKRIRLKRQISTFEGVLPAPVKKKPKLKTVLDLQNNNKVGKIPDEIQRNEGDSGDKGQKPSSCVIDNCKSNYVDNPDITFFGLPIKDEKRRKEWLENIGKSHLICQCQDKERFFVCEKHFELSQFTTTRLKRIAKQKRLIGLAVPTLFSLGKNGKWGKKAVPSRETMRDSPKEPLIFIDSSTQTTELPGLKSSIQIFNSSKFPFILKCDEINRSQWRFDEEADEHVTEDNLVIEMNLDEENLKNKIICEAKNKNTEDSPPSVLEYHNRILMSGIWNFFKQNVETDFQLCWTNENGDEITTNVHHVVLSAFCSSLKNVSEKKFKLNTKLNNEEIEGLIEFLYCGRFDLSNAQIENVLKAGKELGFQLLIDTISETN